MALNVGNVSTNKVAFISNLVAKDSQNQFSESASDSQPSKAGGVDHAADGVIFIRENNVFSKTYTANGTMIGGKSGKNSKYSAEEILSEINRYADENEAYVIWHSGNRHWLQGTKNGKAVGDKKYFDLDSLYAALGKSSPKRMSLKENAVLFDNNSYYKFKGKDGKEHTMLSLGGVLCTGLFRNNSYDKEAADYADFWNCLSKKNPSGIFGRFGNEEIRERLADAGIQGGFFTVTVGGRTATHYLSQGKNTVAVHSKEQYDKRYNILTNGQFFASDKFKPGQTVTVGGKEYILNQEKKLDIKYGEDIFDIQAETLN